MSNVTLLATLVSGMLLTLVGCDTSRPTSATASGNSAATGGTTSTGETSAVTATAATATDTKTENDPVTESTRTETATFGAGCFWGVESAFRKVPGVVATAVGYAGGTTERPTYEEVCRDETGHAEVVQVKYDPAKVDYPKLLEVFFENHDPTTLNRQGPDVGGQYRSVIFFHTPEQEKLARAEKDRRDASGEYVGPIVTYIQPAPTFWAAEDYHQQYFEKKGYNWSCHTGNGKKKKVSAVGR